MIKTMLHPLSITAYLATIILAFMIIFPNVTLDSALRGVAIWWEVLFPALFPFFVFSELMIGFGLVHFFGKILDPFMRPLFRLPGIGGFVITLGYISGYPVGARITAQLWDQGLLNRREGERLVAFTTSSDPIFLIGAVSIGFFHNSELALILAVSHYSGAFLIGLLMRFHDIKAEKLEQSELPHASTSSISNYRQSKLYTALLAMHQARLMDGRPFSVILQQAIQSALRLMIVVGGLVVFFSVVLGLLTEGHILHMLIITLQHIFQWFGISSSAAEAIVPGLFEVTLGAQQSSLISLSLQHQAAIAVAILSWGGLSVHAQVASLLSHTPIRYMPFLLSRLIHAILSVILLYILWGWLGPAA
ncbi:MAG: sporulation integral membrane protein YlbJ [Candidatus Pristimantibacillus lignocellulolyticus]|uniref:Sporulation integral membrane protein YlbJ n=1 Tax=Candidatus Pristimantibacillus lignocellulolyticus TaxID=2994561 RepID=A0A9J6Z9P1_9BACL|nr:MAG: sporulation integral membrane protein YlbJ [Candidatus Pristimantibacillus lignocellulolyticus]